MLFLLLPSDTVQGRLLSVCNGSSLIGSADMQVPSHWSIFAYVSDGEGSFHGHSARREQAVIFDAGDQVSTWALSVLDAHPGLPVGLATLRCCMPH